jgi:NAD+ synthase (glutamine-hydrolysing)
MRIALAQINARVGDLAGNVERIVEAIAEAHRQGAHVVVLPELAVSGYPPEDLLLRPAFLKACEAAVDEICERVSACAPAGELPIAVVGVPCMRPTGLVNSVCVLGNANGSWTNIGRYDKQHLPNYAVFDERRYFRPGRQPGIVLAGEHRLGLTICEDLWIPDNPANLLAAAGCSVIINASASPYHMGKPAERERMLCQRARDTLSFVIYCNMVGGQDELIFDGASLVVGPAGEVLARGTFAQEDMVVVDIDPARAQSMRLGDIRVRELSERLMGDVEALDHMHCLRADMPGVQHAAVERADVQWPQGIAQLHDALCLAIRDYTAKTGFERVVLGVSGGIDSAVVLALAVDALGADRVTGITMPTRFNSEQTISDAWKLMRALALPDAREVEIQPLVQAYQQMGIAASGLSAENIQARIRGNVLMSVSNDERSLVLACGNKSEYAVGYATLYGDTCGGFAPLRDVGKLRVYELARYINERAGREVIPYSVIDRPPSAELADDQRDSDSLPPYEQLDPQLARIIESDEDGVYEPVEQLVWRSEYKRRQAPPGPRVTTKAFGRDRRMPIANAWAADPARPRA